MIKLDLFEMEGVTPLVRSDEEEFRAYVSNFHGPESLDFEDGWAYIIQATRVCPARYYSEHNGVYAILTLKHDYSAIVIPNYFTCAEFIADAASWFTLRFRVPVILKNVDTGNLHALIAEGFREYAEGERWDEHSKYDDQTFPQAIIDLDRVVPARGRTYDDLRYELKKCPPLTYRAYVRGTDHPSVLKMLQIKDRRLGGAVYDAEIMFLGMESTVDTLALVFFIGDRMVGFSLSDRISDSCIAFNAIIHDYSARGLSTRLIWETAKVAREKGYRFGNLQGAETGGLHRWKRKFRPCKEIQKTHLVYRGCS